MNEVANKFYKKTEIDGNSYQISLLPALPALGMAKKLSKVILPIIGGVIDGINDDGFNGAPRTFSDLALTLGSQIDGMDEVEIVNTLLGNVNCNGKQIDINEHFRGDLGAFISLLEFALKENFSSFFTGNATVARFKEALTQMTPLDVEPEE